jgi:hypothetical protein
MTDTEDHLLSSATIRAGTSICHRRIYGLSFLSKKAKHNILGSTAARLFKRPAAQCEAEREPDQARQSRGVA